MSSKLATESILRKVASHLTPGLRSLAKRAYYGDRVLTHPDLKNYGTVQDLYYWVSDGDLDTVLFLQNYFSALYPNLDNQTSGYIKVYDRQGQFLGQKHFNVPDRGGAKLRVSTLIKAFNAAPAAQKEDYGTLEVHIAIPKPVLEFIRGQQRALYFWDRFYITYVNAKGQASFVHGVDKTHIYQDGQTTPQNWHPKSVDHEWAPEIPVDIDDYEQFSMVLLNRTPDESTVTVVVSDDKDDSLRFESVIAAKGAHRFDLNQEILAGLNPKNLRLRIAGMPSQYGRPVAFKKFKNGVFSAMHC